MIRQTPSLIATLLVFLFFLPSTQRNIELEATRKRDRKIALVIGNGAYDVGKLKNPTNDARAMSVELKACGFDVVEVLDADQKTMKKAVRDFGVNLRNGGGVGLFFFAGHGLQLDGRNFLVPVGAVIGNEADVSLETIDADDVLKQMEEAGSQVNIVILDACRNNPFKAAFRRGTNDGLAAVSAPSGTLIAFATAPGKMASDGTGTNGLFTEELLNAMRKPGLSVEDVFNEAGAMVERRSDRKQVPWKLSSLRGKFFFRGDTQPDDSSIEITFWKSIEASRNPKDFEAYLSDYPNGKFKRLALNRLEDLKTTSGASRLDLKLSPGKLERFAGIEFVWIPPGAFEMGSTNGETDEKPVHHVEIKNGFWMGRTEVTQAQWSAVMGENPSRFKGDTLPVEQVSWDMANEFIRRLNATEGKEVFRLPTEAEWEYACRAGTKGDGDVNTLGWHEGNSGGKSHPVASKRPNAWGLYDMLGNVSELVEDWYSETYAGAPQDGSAWNAGKKYRVLRGGAWNRSPKDCRPSFRNWKPPEGADFLMGLRIVRIQSYKTR